MSVTFIRVVYCLRDEQSNIANVVLLCSDLNKICDMVFSMRIAHGSMCGRAGYRYVALLCDCIGDGRH